MTFGLMISVSGYRSAVMGSGVCEERSCPHPKAKPNTQTPNTLSLSPPSSTRIELRPWLGCTSSMKQMISSLWFDTHQGIPKAVAVFRPRIMVACFVPPLSVDIVFAPDLLPDPGLSFSSICGWKMVPWRLSGEAKSVQ